MTFAAMLAEMHILISCNTISYSPAGLHYSAFVHVFI